MLRRFRIRAFTLLELVIVLMIMAALAGLVIAQVAQLGRTTDMATSAKTSSDIAENLQLHFVLNKRYPTHMDSLLVDADGDGAITAAGDGLTTDGVYVPAFDNSGTWIDPPESTQNRGLPDSGPHLDRALIPSLISAGGHRSFVRCGFDFLMDHDGTVTNANNSGIVERRLADGSAATNFFAVVDTDTANSDAQLALSQLFPATYDDATGFYGLPSGVTAVVAVGLGPRSSCIPDTMLNAPLYPGNDGSYYGHYVAYFACFESGERALLVGVSDAYGRLQRYVIEQFNESLPNNQRRG